MVEHLLDRSNPLYLRHSALTGRSIHPMDVDASCRMSLLEPVEHAESLAYKKVK